MPPAMLQSCHIFKGHQDAGRPCLGPSVRRHGHRDILVLRPHEHGPKLAPRDIFQRVLDAEDARLWHTPATTPSRVTSRPVARQPAVMELNSCKPRAPPGPAPGGRAAIRCRHRRTLPTASLRRNSRAAHAKGSSGVVPSRRPCASRTRPRLTPRSASRPALLPASPTARGGARQAGGDEGGEGEALLPGGLAGAGGRSDHHRVPGRRLLHHPPQPARRHSGPWGGRRCGGGGGGRGAGAEGGGGGGRGWGWGWGGAGGGAREAVRESRVGPAPLTRHLALHPVVGRPCGHWPCLGAPIPISHPLAAFARAPPRPVAWPLSGSLSCMPVM